ncbi:hypothetical protein [Paenibacillus guangzhouensis]|uniref:hypothetical protein n=1 Tax=Paenibacillus guangzhouensis TaxID=1473112 RepID=UPI001266C785|nr:hypothetical protein [Paenibacillus guangzhouensis]
MRTGSLSRQDLITYSKIRAAEQQTMSDARALMKGDVEARYVGESAATSTAQDKATGHMESMWQLYDAAIKGFSQVV